MKKPTISMIAAIAENNRAIGKHNKLLWNIPEDLDHFKQITSGHPVIMGYKTYLSMGKLLPNRLNIILTKDKNEIPGAVISQSIPEAIEIASKNDNDEIFFIGGGSVYAQAINYADKIYLTLVKGDYLADTFFPEYSQFNKIISDSKEESNGYKYRYVELIKSR